MKTNELLNRRAFAAKAACCAGCLTALPLTASLVRAAQTANSREEVAKELEEKASKFLSSYGSCSQSSFAALNAQFGLQAEAFIPALFTLSGGIAARGETCGAISGSLLAMGLYLNSKKKSGSAMQLASRFCDQFQKEFGSTRCKEVVKRQYGRYYDFQNPEEQKLFLAESQKSMKCAEVVSKAVIMASDIFLAS